MKVIEAQDVDLIEPFPLTEVKRLLGWLHCYRTMMEVDGDATSEEEKEKYYKSILSQWPSWGVIDKENQLGYKHEAPLIGIVFLQPGAGPNNVYVHLASTRKAWGSGLMDQAAQRLIKHVFDTYPSILRLSGAILNSNKPAKSFAKRMGFKQDGLLKDFVTQNGTACSVAHFGLLRREASWAPQEPQPPQEVIPTSSISLEATAQTL